MRGEDDENETKNLELIKASKRMKNKKRRENRQKARRVAGNIERSNQQTSSSSYSSPPQFVPARGPSRLFADSSDDE